MKSLGRVNGFELFFDGHFLYDEVKKIPIREDKE